MPPCTTAEQFRCRNLKSKIQLQPDTNSQRIWQPQGQNFKFGDGRHYKVDGLRQTLSLQGVYLTEISKLFTFPSTLSAMDDRECIVVMLNFELLFRKYSFPIEKQVTLMESEVFIFALWAASNKTRCSGSGRCF